MRDLRLDFLRGLAIYMIFVDHNIDDPLAKFTYQTIGFSDAAEAFVLISGIACGIVYSRTLTRQGVAAMIRAIIRRAGRIYAFYVLSSIAIILLVCSNPAFVQFETALGVSTSAPLSDALQVLVLASPPSLARLLILYIVLTLLVVPPLLLTRGREQNLLLLFSGLMWLASQTYHSDRSPLGPYVVFDPIAWQFLFAIGVVIGAKREAGETIFKSSDHLRWAKNAAWTFVIAAFAYRLVSARSGLNFEDIRIASHTWASMKNHLSAMRLAHILSMALLVSVYIREDSPWLKWAVVRPITMTGMCSLQIFSLSIVLTTVVNIIVLMEKPSLPYRLGMDGLVFILLGLTAVALSQFRSSSPRPRP